MISEERLRDALTDRWGVPGASGGLLVMLRFRHAVQADYFAHRLLTGDLTGIDSAAENELGLADARRWLARLSGG